MPVSFCSFITAPSSSLEGAAAACNARKILYVIGPLRTGADQGTAKYHDLTVHGEKRISVQAYKRTDVQTYNCTSAPMYKRADVQA